MFDLTGKTALVTGATGGIGGAIAQALLANGAKLAISGTRQEKLDPLAAELGQGTVPLVCNLSQLETVEDLIKSAESTLGSLDILVCNAGITRDNLSMRMKDEEWQEVINVNLTATFRMIRAAMRGMMKRKHGRIICVASVVGVMGNPGQANYCASKAGMIGMAKSIAAEVASRNITVNCIAPGFIQTAMTGVLSADQQERINKNIPVGRMGTSDEVASSAVFLASNEASYITGQTIHVNGGLLMV